MNRRIFLDMDGVLVDFVGGALKIHGWTQEQLRAAMVLGEWDLAKPMGLTQDEFWEPINDAGEWFWLLLKPLPWISEMVELTTALGEWWIVTAPSRDPRSYSGKVKWLQNWFGHDFNRTIFTQDKYLLAKENTLLIDDREKTVGKFIRAGGRGVIFPTLHNWLYYYADDPVTYLVDLLRENKDVPAS